MEKPLLAFDSGVADTGLVSAGRGTAVESILRRLAGDGLLNMIRARNEVMYTLRAYGGAAPAAPPLDDALPPVAVPSVAAGHVEDRVLAEIDQDGFAFAVDPRDEPFFNRRDMRVPRQQNLVDVVLIDGRVCIRKRFRGYRPGAKRWGGHPVPVSDRARRSLWANLGLYLFTEAAALLRLHDLPFVPKLRAVDLDDRAIYLDYLQGESLRDQAASSGAAVHDRELAGDPALCALSAEELERREVSLLEAAIGGDFRDEISTMAAQVNARGVASLDVKLGNFMRGAHSGRLYWIDFEICRLASQPRWEQDLLLQHSMLDRLLRKS